MVLPFLICWFPVPLTLAVVGIVLLLAFVLLPPVLLGLLLLIVICSFFTETSDLGEDELGLIPDCEPSRLGEAADDVATADVTIGDPPSESSSGVPTDMTSESSGSAFTRDVSTELFEPMPEDDVNESNKSSAEPSSQKLRPKSKFEFCGANAKAELPVEALVDSTLNIFVVVMFPSQRIKFPTSVFPVEKI
jgi:hypothetical protein